MHFLDLKADGRLAAHGVPGQRRAMWKKTAPKNQLSSKVTAHTSLQNFELRTTDATRVELEATCTVPISAPCQPSGILDLSQSPEVLICHGGACSRYVSPAFLSSSQF